MQRCLLKYQVLFYCIFCINSTLVSQNLEIGLGVNKNHLWQSDTYISGVSRKDGLGLTFMGRYQNPNLFFLLRNNEAGVEYSRGEIYIGQHTSPGGAGGNRLYMKYRVLSFTLNNYFINFKTLNKPFQVGLGLHFNYKILNQSYGYFTRQKIGWDTLNNHYSFSWKQYSLNGPDNPYTEKLNIGICAGIGFRPFTMGRFTFRTRYEAWTTLGSEVNDGLYFSYLRQNLQLNILFHKKNNTRATEKLLQKKCPQGRKENKSNQQTTFQTGNFR